MTDKKEIIDFFKLLDIETDVKREKILKLKSLESKLQNNFNISYFISGIDTEFEEIGEDFVELE